MAQVKATRLLPSTGRHQTAHSRVPNDAMEYTTTHGTNIRASRIGLGTLVPEFKAAPAELTQR
jgi:hypothetical protein